MDLFLKHARFPVAILIVAAAVCAAAGKADRYIARAMLKMAQNDPKGAIDEATKAIRSEPNNAMAYDARAEAMALKGDYPNALDDLSRAIRLDPNCARAYAVRGNIEAVRKDYAAALSDVETAIRLDPNCALSYPARGQLRRRSGDVEGAVADLEKAASFDPAWNEYFGPELSAAHFDRGQVRVTRGDIDGGIADFSRAIDLNPYDSEAYRARAGARQAKGDQAGAHADLARFVALQREVPAPRPRRLSLKTALWIGFSDSIMQLSSAPIASVYHPARGKDADAGIGATPLPTPSGSSEPPQNRPAGTGTAAPTVSISTDRSGNSTTFLAGQITVSKGMMALFGTIDNATFSCSLVRPVSDGDVLAAMVSAGVSRSIEKAAGYPVLTMIKASDGGVRAFIPALLKFKTNLEAHAVLHVAGFDIETARPITAGDAIPVWYVNGPAILSAEADGHRKDDPEGKPTPWLSVFPATMEGRDATIAAWRIASGLP